MKKFVELVKVMFEFIKRWKERRRRKAILKDIKEAEHIYRCGQLWYFQEWIKSNNI